MRNAWSWLQQQHYKCDLLLTKAKLARICPAATSPASGGAEACAVCVNVGSPMLMWAWWSPQPPECIYSWMFSFLKAI